MIILADQKKLEPGKTIIGTFPTKDESGIIHKYTVYYGNIVSPPIDGKYKPIKKERYMKMLKDFLESDDGLDYEIPTDEEIEDANIQMENRRTLLLAHKEQEEKEQRALMRTQQLQDFSEDIEDVDESESAFEEEKKPGLIGKLKNMRNKPQSEPEEAKPLSKNALEAPYSIMLTLLIISLLLNAFLIYQGLNMQSQRARLNINQETYEIPVTDLNLREGQTKVRLYGITTTIKNGEEVNVAIPLGEMNLDVSK